jgi:hypothetical protein
VALNCVANGKVLRDGAFENIWVQPAAGDAGGALGAALGAYHIAQGRPREPGDGRDRMRGSYVGRYTSTVKDQLPPYVKPTECGNHQDVRWWALTGAQGAGVIAIAPEAPLQVSSLPYDDELLDKAKHTIDLGESTSTTLCISALTMGVGTGACGPQTLPQYRVYAKPVEFTYALRPVPAGTSDLGEIARRPVPLPVKK